LQHAQPAVARSGYQPVCFGRKLACSHASLRALSHRPPRVLFRHSATHRASRGIHLLPVRGL